MLKADSKPQTSVTSPPNVDEYLGVFWKGKLNLSQDGVEASSECPSLCHRTIVWSVRPRQ